MQPPRDNAPHIYGDVEELTKSVGSETPASPLGLHIERTLELSTSSDASSPRTSPFSASNRSALRSSYRNVSHAKIEKKEEDAGYAIPTADDAASDSDEPADPRTPSEQNRSQRVWYQELQHALALEDHERHRRLYALARDFVHASELYGKVIISEAFLPLAEKTIKPWESCPGVAGGTKYLYKDIFFKFATDQLLKDSEVWMYGGAARSDHYAMKAARHELKALKAVYNANVPGINLPLVCVITYRGFSLICISRLPINTDSIVYGSDDATRTMHNDDAHFSALMDRLGERLKLAAHQVRGRRIVGPADIEGHKGPDGKYYLVDLARMFPPEHAPRLGRWVFYHLLRPEFVKSLPTPLSSDVFLGWVRGDPDAKRFEEDVKAATRFLHAQVIPAFAKRMEERADEIVRLGPAKFVQYLHAAGINCRHIGEVRAHCQHAGLRRLLATEVVSRVVKNDIALRLRSKMSELGLAFEAPYLAEVHAYLAVAFSRFPHGPNAIDPRELRGGIALGEGGLIHIGAPHRGAYGYVKANRPLADDLPYFYMEIEVLEDGGGLVVLGVVHARHALAPDRCPGWDDNYAYHGDSGEKFHRNLSESYGPPIHSGDVVGMFWSSQDGTLIFTHNGRSLGVAWHGVRGEWMPIVYGWGETGRITVRPNFGAAPFRVYPATLHPAAEAAEAAEKFWKQDIKQRVEELFPGTLTREEQSAAASLLRAIDDAALVERVSELASLKLGKRVEREIGGAQGFQLLPSDIYALRACVDQLPLAKVSEAAVLLHEVASGQAISPQYSLRLLRMAQDLLDAAEVRNHESLYLSGCIYLEQAYRATPLEEHALACTASQRLREAVEAGSAELGRGYGKALLALGDCLCLLGRRLLIQVQPTEAEAAFEEAEECYARALADPNPDPIRGALKASIRREVRLLEGQSLVDRADGLIRSALARAIPVMGTAALDSETALTLFNGIVEFLVCTGAMLNATHYYEVAAPLLILVTETAVESFHAWVRQLAEVKGSHSKLLVATHAVNILGMSAARDVLLMELAKLKNLDLFNCGSLFTSTNLSVLCNECRQVETLCVSEIRHQTLVDEIVTRLAEHGSLRELRARRCKLTDDGLAAVASLCPHLTNLDLSESHQMTDEGLLLLQGVAPNLRKLRLLGLPATDSFCELVVGRATLLSELCLSHCRLITDEGWARLQTLVNLELFQCFESSLTGARCLSLVQHWPHLNRVLDVRGIRFTKEELLKIRGTLPPTCKITFMLGNTDPEVEDERAAPEGANQT